MSKSRIYEIAKELNVDSKLIVEKLKEMNVEVKNHMSSITEEDAAKVRRTFQKQESPKSQEHKAESGNIAASVKNEQSQVKEERSRNVQNKSNGKDYGSREYYMQMDGQAVFKFAVRKVPQVIENVLSENRMKKGDIKYYILHQANKRIVEAAAKRLEEPVSKFPMNMQEYGNTSSASIPILLYEMKERGQLRSGDRIVLAGFGGGLTWGAVIVTWK